MNRSILSENPNKIVVVICGPAHSGKSVFLNQLYKLLPSKRTHLIRGCPDGEGLWSYGKNQREIKTFRKKGKFSREFVDLTIGDIERSQSDIVLVDVGGIPSEENVRIMSHSDYYVIISSDKDKTLEWEKYVDSFKAGCEVPVQERIISSDGTEALINKSIMYDQIIRDDLRDSSGKREFSEPREPKLLAKFDSVLGEYEDEYVGSKENGIVGQVKNLTRKSNSESLAAIYLANKLIREVRRDRIEAKGKVNEQLREDEEPLDESVKKDLINMNVLREYIDIYTRMFIRQDKKYISKLKKPNGLELFDIRVIKQLKHRKIIRDRVRRAKQKFLLEVKGKDAVKKNVIDMNKVADFFGMCDKRGFINWDREKLIEMTVLLDFLMKDMEQVKVYGHIPNWLAGAIGELGRNKLLEIYKKGDEAFVSAEKFEKTYEPYQKSFDVLESDESVVLYWKRRERYEDVYLPEIPENKRLYISGRLSTIMIASIMQNYENSEKSVNVPGIGFIKCSSKEWKNIGTVERQPRGIDFIGYVEKENGR